MKYIYTTAKFGILASQFAACSNHFFKAGGIRDDQSFWNSNPLQENTEKCLKYIIRGELDKMELECTENQKDVHYLKFEQKQYKEEMNEIVPEKCQANAIQTNTVRELSLVSSNLIHSPSQDHQTT